jgi:predicted dehydrogenase
MVRCLLPGKKALRVFASRARVPGQMIMPALLGQSLIEFEEGQASLAFDASVGVSPWDTSFVTGTDGNLTSVGVDINAQVVTLQRREGSYQPPLTGCWFPDGFQGTMVELLHSIEQRRPPQHSAADNLKSLELCFAAVASAETGQSVRPGEIRRLPE